MAGSEPKEQPDQDDDIFNIERIGRLVELMEQHGLSEIDLRQEDQRIRLRRGSSIEPAVPLMAPPPAAAPAAPPPAAETANMHLIRSPMVGTFYLRPNPESPPFVKVGDHVHPDTTVCVIEAMKVFNEIPADASGQVVAVLVDNEEPVEFGRPLFKLDTSK